MLGLTVSLGFWRDGTYGLSTGPEDVPTRNSVPSGIPVIVNSIPNDSEESERSDASAPGCLFSHSTVRYRPVFSSRPTWSAWAAVRVGDQSRSCKTASIRVDAPGPALPGRPAAVLPHARSGFTGHSKHARTVPNQPAVRNLPTLVRRHRVELPSPVSLYADSHRAGDGSPSLL